MADNGRSGIAGNVKRREPTRVDKVRKRNKRVCLHEMEIEGRHVFHPKPKNCFLAALSLINNGRLFFRFVAVQEASIVVRIGEVE